jgi:hypothetical protein
MFSQPEFLSTPQSKMKNILETSLKESRRKSPGVVRLSDDSEPEFSDDTPPRVLLPKKCKLFDTIGDPLGKAKRPLQTFIRDDNSF